MLENVRFNKGEKKGDPEFAAQLAGLADAYVNDAFGTCHRDEASMVAVPECFPPERRAIGFLVEKELQILETLLGQPEAADGRGDGGGEGLRQDPGHREPAAQGRSAPDRRGDDLHVPEGPGARDRQEPGRGRQARRGPPACSSWPAPKLVLPQDHLVATALDAGAETKVVAGSDIPDGWFGIDIGPATVAAYGAIIREAGTVVWNGPMGKFEDEPFRKGTLAVAEAMAESPAVTVVGGGETAEAVEQFGFADKVTHVSTGGGAFLESLEGKSFNSLKVIPDR